MATQTAIKFRAIPPHVRHAAQEAARKASSEAGGASSRPAVVASSVGFVTIVNKPAAAADVVEPLRKGPKTQKPSVPDTTWVTQPACHPDPVWYTHPRTAVDGSSRVATEVQPPKAIDPSKPSLALLPPEIRCAIYKMLLPDQIIMSFDKEGDAEQDEEDTSTLLSLLRLSSGVCDEFVAEAFLYRPVVCNSLRSFRKMLTKKHWGIPGVTLLQERVRELHLNLDMSSDATEILGGLGEKWVSLRCPVVGYVNPEYISRALPRGREQYSRFRRNMKDRLNLHTISIRIRGSQNEQVWAKELKTLMARNFKIGGNPVMKFEFEFDCEGKNKIVSL